MAVEAWDCYNMYVYVSATAGTLAQPICPAFG